MNIHICNRIFDTIVGASKQALLVFISIILLCFSATIYAHTITVVGMNNIAVDRPAIQAAIYSAKPGDTIYLAGIFQLDGKEIYVTQSNLTITGAGKNSGWSTLIKGVTASNSSLSPAQELSPPNYAFFDRGFKIGAEDGSVSVSNVTIQNIKFQSLNRAIRVEPAIGGDNGACPGYGTPSSITFTNNTASHITIANNWFYTDFDPIEAWGYNDHLSLVNNLFTNNVGYNDMDVEGPGLCFFGPSDSTSEILPSAVESFVSVLGNTAQNDNQVAYQTTLDFLNVNNGIVAGNKLSNLVGGNVIFMSGRNLSVVANILDGANATAGGISAEGVNTIPPIVSGLVQTNNIIALNQINNGLPGIEMNKNTTGYTMFANHFSGTQQGYAPYGVPDVGDVLLCNNINSTTAGLCFGHNLPASYNNTVVAVSCTHVLDLGINDKLLGLINSSNNVNNPPNGACTLIK